MSDFSLIKCDDEIIVRVWSGTGTESHMCSFEDFEKGIKNLGYCAIARAEKAEAQAEKLSKHINKFQKSSCMDAGCCPDDITNCTECIIKHF